MKDAILFLMFAVSFLSLNAQDIYLMNNIQNPMQFNPAATGLVYNNRIAASEQIMLGWSNGPLTAQVNYEKSIDSTAWGFGILALHDDIGFFDEEHLEGHIRYSFINHPKTEWASGIALIFNSQNLSVPENHWIIPGSNTKPDPAILYKLRASAIRYSIGSWIKNRWGNAGISFYGTIHQFDSNDTGFTFYNRYTAYTSVKIVNRKNLQLRPDILFDQWDNYHYLFYGLNLSFLQNYRAGLKIRSDKKFIPSVGLDFRKFSIDVTMMIPEKHFINCFSALQLAYNFN